MGADDLLARELSRFVAVVSCDWEFDGTSTHPPSTPIFIAIVVNPHYQYKPYVAECFLYSLYPIFIHAISFYLRRKK